VKKQQGKVAFKNNSREASIMNVGEFFERDFGTTNDHTPIWRKSALIECDSSEM
jgi:hypothetical protein